MAYAITRTCCNDASCVSVCPVNCIHPTPDEPGFGSTEMLFIDPAACIDCGACADACPVDAIFPVDRLLGPDLLYGELNRAYYEENPTDHGDWDQPVYPRSLPVEAAAARAEPLRVAVVGTGPSASYTAQALLHSTEARITMVDRLPVAGGLLRHGVAPDHQQTKRIGEAFAGTLRHPRLRLHLGVEVGRDITHEELAAHHDAVVYAVGAAGDRRLGLPGEELPGSLPATTVVGWYNADPTVPADAVDLTGPDMERVVLIGNGNVALDVARVLLSPPEALAETDIAEHALAALRESRVREVVLLARRGPEESAWTRPEFLALRELPGVELQVDAHPQVRAELDAAQPGSKAALLAELESAGIDWAEAPRPGRRIVFRFLATPTELLGESQVTGLRVTDSASGADAVLRTGLVVRSIGYRGVPVPGLPFDDELGAIPQRGGRVLDANGVPLPGVYVVGWAKRGPSGGIGANRACAEETVGALLDDAAAGTLPAPTRPLGAFARMVRGRRPEALGLRGLRAVDRAERARGRAAGRPRVKLATVPELLAAGRRGFLRTDR